LAGEQTTDVHRVRVLMVIQHEHACAVRGVPVVEDME
jgi:hypothetical protein